MSSSAFHLFDPSDSVAIHQGNNLPHWFQPEATHFQTFRTVDSIPPLVAERWRSRQSSWLRGYDINDSVPGWKLLFATLPREVRDAFHQKFSSAFMDALDAGHGACPLSDPAAASEVVSAMRHFDGVRYHLGDFVVMPNHVHVLLTPIDGHNVVSIATSWKRFSARHINQMLVRSGRFWQAESFDHLVRHAKQLHRIRKYIEENPKHLADGEFTAWRSPEPTPPLPTR